MLVRVGCSHRLVGRCRLQYPPCRQRQATDTTMFLGVDYSLHHIGKDRIQSLPCGQGQTTVTNMQVGQTTVITMQVGVYYSHRHILGVDYSHHHEDRGRLQSPPCRQEYSTVTTMQKGYAAVTTVQVGVGYSGHVGRGRLQSPPCRQEQATVTAIQVGLGYSSHHVGMCRHCVDNLLATRCDVNIRLALSLNKS